MKLRKVNFTNHFIFKDLELSFINESSQVFNTIIFAGENGAGKTVLLNTLYELIKLPINNQKISELLGQGSYEFEFSKKEMEETLFRVISEEELKPLLSIDKFIIKIEFNTKKSESYCNIYQNEMQSLLNHNVNIHFLSYIDNISKIRGIFSDTEINFESSSIYNITASQVDDIQYEKLIRSKVNSPTILKQLLIDLYSQDNSKIANAINNSNPEVKCGEIRANLDLKINRFKSAFEKIIENKKMVKSDVLEGSHQIIFKDLRNNQEISIDDLSSGEKQIIYRGSFLLQNQKVLEDPIVFIDEPEISLHPDWQIKILDFYKNILTNQTTNQLEAQLFVVTHSPFILHNINLDTDKVIILERDENGNARQKQSNEFYNYTSPELIKSAFKLPTEMFVTEKNIIFVEGKTDKQYIDKTIDTFNLPANNIEVKFIGSYKANQNNGSGESNLQKALEFLSDNHTIYKQKICILFDNDDGKNLSEKQTKFAIENKILVKTHEFNKNNAKNITRGIENLIEFSTDFCMDDYFEEDEKEYPTGFGRNRKVTIPVLKKQKLADDICKLDNSVLKRMLLKIKESLEPIIDEINK